MRLCVRSHGQIVALKGATRLLAVALVALIGTAPLASSWHELTVRHVVCAEHGELTHVRASQALGVTPIQDFGSAEGQPTETLDGHEHCASGFIVRGRAHRSVVRSVVRYTPPLAVIRDVGAPRACPGRSFVLASAPKTSPPTV
jgi:hypothetical protein